ncbi:amino acid ABC transporter ATP-binding protein [Mesorhizobium sp. M7D.F.Ca.US.004.01.2.1]|uniref:amino acid ABC transporter ATP-binding protein n=2 Tax=unclassified Mesorhizobium TaxID=325217 RepID=UPI000FCB2A09|nr:amino acid ABC transporter ATP-binding protein [Mesorhizobium sp. M7D.F.Ca.US.004.01.2.1]RUX86296.1 amino acid ABC transporter ATP-binding protein [Mesorhizobium sp. M7D.F.Ca.US.004.01.2.1]
MTLAAPANGDVSLLRLQNIEKSFGSLKVLQGISVEVARGEVVAIIGGSGSGKSTLLRCVNLMERPSAGRIEFGNFVADFDGNRKTIIGEERLRQLRTQIGMVFQSYNLWPHKTVMENVMCAPMLVKGVSRRDAAGQAEQLLDRIGLAQRRNHYPFQLSGGQQQRVAIVRALAMQPKAMLFDEVTSALDPELVGEVLGLMAELANEGMTMLIVTHEIAFARDVSSRTLFFDRGVIAESGPSRDVLRNPQSERMRQFLSRVLHESY